MVDGHETVTREARWAARDAKREAHEAWMEDQRMQSREHHIAIVQAAGVPRSHAETAIDALKSAGVVFAYMSDWDDDRWTDKE